MVVSASHPEMMDMEDKEDIVAKLSKEGGEEEEEVIDVETDEVELEEDYDEMEEMVDATAMDEDMEQMEGKKEREVIYGEDEKPEEKHPKIKINKEGEIAIYESEEKITLGHGIKHTRISTFDQDAIDKAFKGTHWWGTSKNKNSLGIRPTTIW